MKKVVNLILIAAINLCFILALSFLASYGKNRKIKIEGYDLQQKGDTLLFIKKIRL